MEHRVEGFAYSSKYGIQLRSDLNAAEAEAARDTIDRMILEAEEPAVDDNMPFVPALGVFDSDKAIQFDGGGDVSKQPEGPHTLWASIPCDRHDIVELIGALPAVDRIEVQGSNSWSTPVQEDFVVSNDPRPAARLILQPFTNGRTDATARFRALEEQYKSVSHGPYPLRDTGPEYDLHREFRGLERDDLSWWMVAVDCSGAADEMALEHDLLLFHAKLEAVTTVEMWTLKDPNCRHLLDELVAKPLEDVFERPVGDPEWFHGYLLIRTPREDCEAVREVLGEFVLSTVLLE